MRFLQKLVFRGALAALTLTTAVAEPPRAPKGNSWKITFEDDFNGPLIEEKKLPDPFVIDYVRIYDLTNGWAAPPKTP